MKKIIQDKQLLIRRIFLMCYDVLAVFAASIVALLIRFDLNIMNVPFQYMDEVWRALPFMIIVTLVIFWLLRLYSSLWSYAGALEMMYVTRNDTLMPISNEQKVNMARRFKLFPVLDYTLESFGFSQYTGNEVKFRGKFAEEDAADNKPAAYTSLRFCPVKYNADWYLTIESE